MIPNEPAKQFQHANDLLEQGECDKALRIYDELIRVSRKGEDFDFNFIVDSYRIFSNKATALKRLGRFSEAVEAYTLALKNGGHVQPSIFRMRAEAHLKKGDLDAAIADLESSLRLDPESNVALYNLVCYSAQKKDLERVAKYFTRFAELFPDEKEDLAKDPDLDAVRDNPAFEGIVSGA